MPQLDPAVFTPQLFWLAISFALLYLVMSRIALPRIGAAIKDRQNRIAADLDEAQRMKDRAEAAAAAYEVELAQARQRAQSLAKETQDRLAMEAEETRKALEADLSRRIAEAEAHIAASRAESMKSVQSIAVDSAVAIVAELAGIKVNGREVKKAVEASLAEAV